MYDRTCQTLSPVLTRTTVSVAMRALRHLYLAYLAKPAGDRILYRTLRQHRCQSIVEIGIGSIERTERLLTMAAERNLVDGKPSPPRYAAIDGFDLREDKALPLKTAFTRLRGLTSKLRLAPGDPNAVLRSAANDMLGADLLLFTEDAFASLTPAAWFFVPRILKQCDGDKVTTGNNDSAGVTRIFVAEADKDGALTHRAVTADEINRLASGGTQRRAA